jgi:hypothetical protein
MSLFFVRQRTNQCGLHAIQNMFKSAKINNEDMRNAVEVIHEKTGDNKMNHESFGGDWSVSAVVTAIKAHGYDVERGVMSKANGKRDWSGQELETLLEDDKFQGVIIHQPTTRHYTCIRPELINGQKHFFYVDSQSEGPIRISSRLAMRRCLSAAYAWEPYIVKGSTMEYVAPTPLAMPEQIARQNRFNPTENFMREWRSLPRTDYSQFLQETKTEAPELREYAEEVVPEHRSASVARDNTGM